MVVSDDGAGFDTENMAIDYESKGSLGMVNMRERAERIEGSLRLESTPGTGTTVTLVVPLAGQLPQVEDGLEEAVNQYIGNGS